MAYADSQTLKQRSAGIAGVVLIHAGLGAVLVLGLATDVVPRLIDTGPMPTREWKDDPPLPPPEPQTQPETPSNPPKLFIPPVPNPLNKPIELSDTTIELPPLTDDLVLDITPKQVPVPTPGLAAVEPTHAVPRNDPGRWVTDSDYKSRWVREGLSGVARFSLDIAANGRVTGCVVTRSSGHQALDDATCALIAKRARFKPAKTPSGEATGGTYSSSIRWQLPE